MTDTRMPRFVAGFIGLPLLLAACAAPHQPIPKYVAPQTGPTARLLMRGTMDPGDRYGVFLFDNASDCKGMRIAAAGGPQRDPAAVTIPASGISTVDIFVSKADKTYCRVRWSFSPRPGGSYVVTPRSTPGGCTGLILDASDVDKMKPEATLLRRDAPGNACVPLASSKSLAQLVAQGGANGTAAARPPAAAASGAQLPGSSVTDDDLKALTSP
ncbi:MAG TPA: hypothetical protein VJO99_26015 [Burkholderiaceae bacterium]|nr:hypothetical protein [Burkholderiaceae bacterium]